MPTPAVPAKEHTTASTGVACTDGLLAAPLQTRRKHSNMEHTHESTPTLSVEPRRRVPRPPLQGACEEQMHQAETEEAGPLAGAPTQGQAMQQGQLHMALLCCKRVSCLLALTLMLQPMLFFTRRSRGLPASVQSSAWRRSSPAWAARQDSAWQSAPAVDLAIALRKSSAQAAGTACYAARQPVYSLSVLKTPTSDGCVTAVLGGPRVVKLSMVCGQPAVQEATRCGDGWSHRHPPQQNWLHRQHMHVRQR